MKPEEKAAALIDRYSFCITTYKGTSIMHKEIAKQCALITADEIMNTGALNQYLCGYSTPNKYDFEYWQQVRIEIEKL